MNKKYIKVLVTCLIIEFLIGITVVQRTKIIQLENNQNIEELALEKCPFCDGEAVIQPVNNSFYIECEKCKIHTDYFKSRRELAEYWNNRD